MRATIQLDEMTTAEKIGVMEQIWEDLCRNAEAVPSPAWHAPLLHERQAQLDAGAETATDWADAKKRIRESLS